MEVREELHALTALTRRRIPRYTLDRKLGGPQDRSGVISLTAPSLITLSIKTS